MSHAAIRKLYRSGRARVRTASAGRSKYGAKPTTVDGIRFHSAREAARYGELKLLLQSGSIRNFILQPVYRLFVRPFASQGRAIGDLLEVGKYVGDFQYDELTETGGRWDCVVEDVKGVKTPVYRLKKKIVEALYGIQIREVR